MGGRSNMAKYQECEARNTPDLLLFVRMSSLQVLRSLVASAGHISMSRSFMYQLFFRVNFRFHSNFSFNQA